MNFIDFGHTELYEVIWKPPGLEKNLIKNENDNNEEKNRFFNQDLDKIKY